MGPRPTTETLPFGAPNGRESTSKTPSKEPKERTHTHLLQQMKHWPHPSFLRWAMGEPPDAVRQLDPHSLFFFFCLPLITHSKILFCPSPHICVSYLFVCQTNWMFDPCIRLAPLGENISGLLSAQSVVVLARTVGGRL